MCHLYIKTYSVVLIKVPNWHKIIKKKKQEILSSVGFELTTSSLKRLYSTDWASRAMMWKEQISYIIQ